MKLPTKILNMVLLTVVVLVIILIAAFYLFGELALKLGIETAATRALNVGVYIDDVDLSVLAGRVEIDGLIVRNPPGYTYENLLELRDGSVTARVGSMLKDTVYIKQVKLDGVNLVIEQKPLSNNLQDVIKSLPAKEKEEPSGKKLHIEELEITNIKVRAKLLPVPGKADTVTLELAPIRMSNLGTDDKLSTGRLANKIVLAIADGVARQGVGVLPNEIVNMMKTTLGTTIDLGKAATKEGGKLIETGKEVSDEIVEGFKGLIKPKKEK